MGRFRPTMESKQMRETRSESPESLATEGGGDPEVTGVYILPHAPMESFHLASILSVLGVAVEDPKGFNVSLKIHRRKEPGGNYVTSFSLVEPPKPKHVAAEEERGIDRGHGPVGPETD